VIDLSEKFDRVAEGFSEAEYKDPDHYNRRRAEAVFNVGPNLPAGATVLDLGCGDASFAGEVLSRGFCYIGVDSSRGMCAAARDRVGDRGTIEQGDLASYAPVQPVDMTLMLRVLYLVNDRVVVLRRIADYTRIKVVFDLSARQLSLEGVAEDVSAAGFDGFDVRPMLVSMRYAPSPPVDAIFRALERSGPPGHFVARRRFRLCCAAFHAAA